MAIKYLSGNRLQGLAADTKPTTVPIGSRFEETDTFDDYKFDGTDWILMTGCFNPNAAESLTNKNLVDATNTFRAWTNGDISASAAIAWSKIAKTGSIIGDIANVVITSVAAGDRLTYDGTNWVNSKNAITPFWFAGPTSSIQLVTQAFYPIGMGIRTGTESTTQVTFPFNIALKRLICKFNTNALAGASVVAFRDDGANATSLTIAAGNTTEQDSGAINVVIAAGSKINWMVDTSASAAANWFIEYMVALGVIY